MGPGSFTFRYWLDDTRPPTVTLQQPRVSRGTPLVVRVNDAGSGVDPATVKVTVDGTARDVRCAAGMMRIPTATLKRGPHGLRVQASDYQESRNMENVPPILPEYARAQRDGRRPLTCARVRLTPEAAEAAHRGSVRVSRSSIVGSASRSAWTLRTNSSSSVETTRSFAFRFSRSRWRRASAPTRRSNLGHSAATTMPMPIASSTIHGQLTASV